jgi:hypothetical protein
MDIQQALTEAAEAAMTATDVATTAPAPEAPQEPAEPQDETPVVTTDEADSAEPEATPEDETSVDAESSDAPVMPDGYVAVPVVSDKLATEFTLKDAEGEVARSLGCRTYYAVLELDENTDDEAVRKAHRRKGARARLAQLFTLHADARSLIQIALLVHPDKCSSPYAKAAFQRVQDGFMLLKGALGCGQLWD